MSRLIQRASVYVLVTFLASVSLAQLSIEPRFESSERFGETFTAAFHGADDTFFLFQFIFSNAGFGDRKAACRLLWAPLNHRAQNFMARFDDDEWRFEKSTNKLTLGSCQLESGVGGTTFIVKHGKYRATLSTSAVFSKKNIPGQKPNDGFYNAELLLDGAKAIVNWSLGQKEAQTAGRVYFDHTRSTASMASMANVVYRVRAMGKKSIFAQFVRSKTIFGWAIKSKQEKFDTTVGKGVRIKESDLEPRLEFTHEGQQMQVKVRKLLYRYKPVEAFGVMGKLASPIIGNPETTTFLATLVQADGTAIPAVMERTIVDP